MGRPPTNTKLRLLETAHELIWRNSYGSVSVDGICEKANVKKGSFYHYFPSKADLAMASIDWWMTNTIPFLDDIFSPSRHPIDRFTLLIDFIYEKQEDMRIEFGQVCGCPFITIGSELAAQDEIIGAKISAITQQKMTYYQNALRDMIAMGLIDEKTNVELKAEEIYAFITGNMMLARIKNDLKFMKTSLKPSLMNLIGVELSTEDLKKLTI
ncbi:MAG: TetR/AcrR family transcriptional regulator [Rhodomicrobiaceae bacterium]|jgi:TetR/AcrR family transcriptional repressor of nem operon